MTGPRIGLTDLERAKYTEDSTIEESTVRVRTDAPVEVQVLDQPIDVSVINEADDPIPVEITGQPVQVEVTGQPIAVEEQNLPLPVQITGQPIQVDVINSIADPVIVEPIKYPTVPRGLYRYKIAYLATSGGATDQNVNGSTTPVDFFFEPATDVYLQSVTLAIVGLNMVSVTDYFGIAGGLTNGILLLTREGVTEVPMFTIKKTIELAHASKQGLNTNTISGNTSEDIVVTDLLFPIEALCGPGKRIIVRIRDNLAVPGVKYQRASVVYREPV